VSGAGRVGRVEGQVLSLTIEIPRVNFTAPHSTNCNRARSALNEASPSRRVEMRAAQGPRKAAARGVYSYTLRAADDQERSMAK